MNDETDPPHVMDSVGVVKNIGSEPYVPPSTLAKHPDGVLYQGEFETPSDGTALAVRLHAKALAATGVPLGLRSFSGMVINEHNVAEPVFAAGIPDEVRAQVGHLLDADIGQFRPVIKHAVIQNAAHCNKLLVPPSALLFSEVAQQIAMRNAIYDNTIVYSVWERDRIDPAIARQLARVKQCWVPCEHNREMLVRSGVPEDRVHVVPHPYEPDALLESCLKRKPRVGERRFYSIGRWEPRKGMVDLLQAFLMAFTPSDAATLTIKYTGGQWPGYPTPDETMAGLPRISKIRDRGWNAQSLEQRVRLIDGRLKRSKIVQLHYEHDIYVSASMGEAWGLPAFEARRAGNRLVYVPYGGVSDFAALDDVQVPYQMRDVDSSYRWERDARWAWYDIEHLAEALRAAWPRTEVTAPFDFEERFSMAAVGKLMRDLLEKAAPGIYPQGV